MKLHTVVPKCDEEMRVQCQGNVEIVQATNVLCCTSWEDASKLGAMTSRYPEQSASQLFTNILTNLQLCALSLRWRS